MSYEPDVRRQPDAGTGVALAGLLADHRGALRRVACAILQDPAYAGTEAGSRGLAAVRTLPPRRRAAITLFSLEGMDLRETAQAMGCSVGAVKAHLFHARNALRLQLGDMLSPEV